MNNQISYYNLFGEKYKTDILNAKDPSVWTSDMKTCGPIFQLMKERINNEKKFILAHFNKNEPTLDVGCGFGRTSFILANNGFTVVGVDNSPVFIDIAQMLFFKHKLNGKFICESIFDFKPTNKFKQLLLLDVYEHIRPVDRTKLLKHIAINMCQENAQLIITFPSTERFKIKNRIFNILKIYYSGNYLNKCEHPYNIPNKKSFESHVGKYFSIISSNIIGNSNLFLLKLA